MAQIAVNVGMNCACCRSSASRCLLLRRRSSVLMLYICVGLVLSVYSHNTKSLFG